MLYVAPAIFLVLFVAFFLHDRRHLLNPVWLIAFLGTSYLALTNFAYDYGQADFHQTLLVLGFAFLPLALFLSGFFLIINGFILLKKEGKSKANFLSLAAGLAIILVFALPLFLAAANRLAPDWSWLVQLLTVTAFFSLVVLGGLFAGFLIYSILYNLMPKRKDYDFIIIHGAGLLDGERVTPLLKKRIDKAVEAYRLSDKSHVRLIASGGQGADEKVSEAQAIANYLESIGFPMDKVLLEDKSRTTYENLIFSKVLGKALVDQPRFLFVTNDYHVLRTSLYARKAGLVGDGLGCATASYYIPSAFIREYVAFLTKIKWLLIIIYLPFVLMMVLVLIGLFV